MIEFIDDEGPLGSVELVDGELVGTGMGIQVIRSYLGQRKDPARFEAEYENYANGYVHAVRKPDTDGVPTQPVKPIVANEEQ